MNAIIAIIALNIVISLFAHAVIKDHRWPSEINEARKMFTILAYLPIANVAIVLAVSIMGIVDGMHENN